MVATSEYLRNKLQGRGREGEVSAGLGGGKLAGLHGTVGTGVAHSRGGLAPVLQAVYGAP